jgi:hypothetical protein
MACSKARGFVQATVARKTCASTVVGDTEIQSVLANMLCGAVPAVRAKCFLACTTFTAGGCDAPMMSDTTTALTQDKLPVS